jgi:hypothetical protein
MAGDKVSRPGVIPGPTVIVRIKRERDTFRNLLKIGGRSWR